MPGIMNILASGTVDTDASKYLLGPALIRGIARI
jgi:hypothetical protein